MLDNHVKKINIKTVEFMVVKYKISIEILYFS